MPIRREFRRFYTGRHWAEVRARIQARALDACEACGVRNHTRVYRRGGWWFDDVAHHWRGPDGSFTFPPRGLRRRFVRIVCATCHLNHVSGDDRDENLMFLCQWHHWNHDKARHKETRSIRKDRARPLLQQEAISVQQSAQS